MSLHPPPTQSSPGTSATALLDVGSSKIACAIIAATGELLGRSLVRSHGLTAGHVVEPALLAGAVAKALVEAEQAAGVRATYSHLAVSGGAVALQHFAAEIALDPPIVTAAAAARLESELNSHATRNGRCIIQAAPFRYRLDDRAVSGRPVDRFGRRLEAFHSCITMDAKPLGRLVGIVDATGVPVRRVMPAGLAAALAVTTPEQRAGSIAVVDIGATETAVTAYVGGVPTLVTSLALGVAHVEAALAELQGEEINHGRIDTNRGSSCLAHADAAELLGLSVPKPNPPSAAACAGAEHLETRSGVGFSANDHGCLERLLRLVADRLDAPTAALMPDSPVVLTGGGSRLANLAPAAAWMWAREVRLGQPSAAPWAAPEWAVIAGLAAAPAESGVATAPGLSRSRAVA